MTKQTRRKGIIRVQISRFALAFRVQHLSKGMKQLQGALTSANAVEGAGGTRARSWVGLRLWLWLFPL